MQLIKGNTAFYANKLLKRTGQFWQKDSYDHYVRNEREFWNIVRYILQNPVKAKLVDNWEEFPFTFVGDSYRQRAGDFSR
jgi:putative transposase